MTLFRQQCPLLLLRRSLPPSPLPKPQPEESQENRIATASAGPVPEQGRNNFERFFAEALEGGTMEVGVFVTTLLRHTESSRCITATSSVASRALAMITVVACLVVV